MKTSVGRIICVILIIAALIGGMYFVWDQTGDRAAKKNAEEMSRGADLLREQYEAQKRQTEELDSRWAEIERMQERLQNAR